MARRLSSPPRRAPSDALRALLVVASLAGAAVAPAAPDPPAPAAMFFYLTAEPDVGKLAHSAVMHARFAGFDRERLVARWNRALEEHRGGADWYGYSHHAYVHGPFASREEAEADLHTFRASRPWMRAEPMPALGGWYHEKAVLVLPVAVPPIESALDEPGALRASRRALQGLPCSVHAAPVPDLVLVPVGRLEGATAPLDAALARAAEHCASGLLVVHPAEPRLAAAVRRAREDLLGRSRACAGRVDVLELESSAPEATRLLREEIRRRTGAYVPPLVINELVSSNATGAVDEAGEHDDWVEIYNAGPVPIDLAGMRLSDRADGGRAVPIRPGTRPEDTLVPASGRLVLWLDQQPAQGARHVGLRLSSRGEQVVLLDVDGQAVIDEVAFPALPPDASYARVGDGASRWSVLQRGSPGAPNPGAAP